MFLSERAKRQYLERNKIMCLDTKYPRTKIKKLPKEFTAYKVVHKRNGKYYFPIRQKETRIKKTNELPTLDILERVGSSRKRYKTYYHCFRSIAAPKALKALGESWTYIKIRIKRKDISCIGTQGPDKKTQYQVIVSRKFTTKFEEISI